MLMNDQYVMIISTLSKDRGHPTRLPLETQLDLINTTVLIYQIDPRHIRRITPELRPES